ncbi:MAG: Ig-like domain-containing protein, partial [Ignavibacteriaceae bacterium]
MKTNNTIKIKSAKIIFYISSLLLVFSNISFSQPITGLSGWNIYLDPGHSQYENMGIYNYSEAEKNLGVALHLRQMLLDWTDIDTVYICRTNSTVIVGLRQRTDDANAKGAAHYHSIHSDAGGTTANSTLIMWGQIGIGGPEKTPYGGKRMSQIMVGLLTAGMRTTTRGAMGDRDFYQADNPWPYLSVNHYSTMASELSEAGFHTNPTQNQLNMNDKWKRLEAKTMFWTILKYHNIERPFAGTVVGIIKDSESGLAVNGAVATLNGQSDTTDTYQSLFYKYSTGDSTLLRNGFYYFEDIPAGTHQLQVTAPGFDPYTVDVTTADTFFTFQDVKLISNVSPTITSTSPVDNDSLYPGKNNITINFSRPINIATVDSNIVFSPDVSAAFTWSSGNKTLTINTTNFDFDTVYQITVKGNIEDQYEHLFDGNGDGVSGDDYVFNIKTKVEDMIPPSVVDVYPAANATNVELKPIINVSFDEPLNTSTVSTRIKVIKNSDQSNASYILRHYSVNRRSVLNFFITAPLTENESYSIKILAGIEDSFGNPTTSDYYYEFTTGNSNYLSQTIIDNFESGISNWWQPSQSGSTVGTISELTNISAVSSIFNINTSSTKSMRVNYSYDE